MSQAHVFSLALLFALGSAGMGQDAPSAPASLPTQTAPRAKQPPAAQPADKKQPGTKQPDARPPLRQEHVIYVPFKNLRNVFEREDSSIVLPYAQFLEMWDRLIQPDRQPIKPPVNGVITRADYAGSVKGELAYLDATLDVEALSASGPSCRCSSAMPPSDRRGAKTKPCCCEGSARGDTNYSCEGRANTRSSCTW